MKHPEGMAITLVEESMLEGSGILKTPAGSTNPFGLPEESVALFMAIALGGETGVTITKLPKDLRENLKEALLPLELKNLVDWERDRHGKQVILVLSWQGKDALEAAKTKPTNHASWGTRRKLSVNPGASRAAPDPTPTASGSIRRRAAFLPEESAVVSPDAPRRTADASVSSVSEGPVSSFDDLFAGDVSFSGLDEALSQPMRRRAAQPEDNELFEKLTCSSQDDPETAAAVQAAAPEVSPDEFDQLYDQMP